MVDGASTEFPVKLLGPQAPKVMDSERPEVQHIVPGEGIPLLHYNHLGSQVGEFNGSAQATWSSSDDETLWRERRKNLDGTGSAVTEVPPHQPYHTGHLSGPVIYPPTMSSL